MGADGDAWHVRKQEVGTGCCRLGIVKSVRHKRPRQFIKEDDPGVRCLTKLGKWS